MITTPTLLDHHRAQLVASGIDPSVIAERGYFSATTIAELKRYGFGEVQCNVPALGIPIYGPDGKVVLYQSKPDAPRIASKTGKPIKYETPSKARMALNRNPGEIYMVSSVRYVGFIGALVWTSRRVSGVRRRTPPRRCC